MQERGLFRKKKKLRRKKREVGNQIRLEERLLTVAELWAVMGTAMGDEGEKKIGLERGKKQERER